MKINKYQELALRTAKVSLDWRLRISNWCMGITGEVGELINYIKKQCFHNHERNIDYIKEELGDILWYLSVIASEYDLKLKDIMEYNIKKLKKRYPNGFTELDSKNRKI